MFEVLFPESMDDGPAAVTLDRFLDAFSDWKGAGIEHKLGVVFQMLDADGKEVLTVHDFTSFLANLGRYKPYVGDTMRVKADGRAGILRFVGPTKFENGIWAGLELPSAVGKNDGSVAGVRYFQCEPKRGVFIPVDQVQLLRHYEASCEIMKHFSSVNVEKVILSSDEFVEKMKADPWIVSLFDKILVSQDR
ncbi:hypothetical protein M427DRAFT_453150 [Gonapodya prolifera JEL478]|uniref:CAP-Gly domain-containing protein n=1 Tax=Gonapodya prolifera (strain JEL478) TaxID=1344416 RepID=A0A139AS36_GONPJ|nr:hypothetical protein M427DRAFT_453150 [Gonapodya prolifera JEL478]|eukprot:KXS19550.1 hypothetical protein M427DRAFT_453150 [Gonapodya prolifera JEL478]